MGVDTIETNFRHAACRVSHVDWRTIDQRHRIGSKSDRELVASLNETVILLDVEPQGSPAMPEGSSVSLDT